MAFKQSCWKWLCNERILDLQIWEFSLNIKSFVWCLMQNKLFPWPFYHGNGFLICPEQLFLLKKEIVTRTILKSVAEPRSKHVLLDFFFPPSFLESVSCSQIEPQELLRMCWGTVSPEKNWSHRTLATFYYSDHALHVHIFTWQIYKDLIWGKIPVE